MGSKISHVANATSEIIYAKCQDNPSKVDFSFAVNATTPGGGGGVNCDFRDTTPSIPAGFVAIDSGDYIAFPSGTPHLSIISASGRKIAENYNPGTNQSVIATPEFTLTRTKMGELWIGRNGRDYGNRVMYQ